MKLRPPLGLPNPTLLALYYQSHTVVCLLTALNPSGSHPNRQFWRSFSPALTRECEIIRESHEKLHTEHQVHCSPADHYLLPANPACLFVCDGHYHAPDKRLHMPFRTCNSLGLVFFNIELFRLGWNHWCIQIPWGPERTRRRSCL